MEPTFKDFIIFNKSTTILVELLEFFKLRDLKHTYYIEANTCKDITDTSGDNEMYTFISLKRQKTSAELSDVFVVGARVDTEYEVFAHTIHSMYTLYNAVASHMKAINTFSCREAEPIGETVNIDFRFVNFNTMTTVAKELELVFDNYFALIDPSIINDLSMVVEDKGTSTSILSRNIYTANAYIIPVMNVHSASIGEFTEATSKRNTSTELKVFNIKKVVRISTEVEDNSVTPSNIIKTVYSELELNITFDSSTITIENKHVRPSDTSYRLDESNAIYTVNDILSPLTITNGASIKDLYKFIVDYPILVPNTNPELTMTYDGTVNAVVYASNKIFGIEVITTIPTIVATTESINNSTPGLTPESPVNRYYAEIKVDTTKITEEEFNKLKLFGVVIKPSDDAVYQLVKKHYDTTQDVLVGIAEA